MKHNQLSHHRYRSSWQMIGRAWSYHSFERKVQEHKHPSSSHLRRNLGKLNRKQRNGSFSWRAQGFVSITLGMDQHQLGCGRKRGKERLSHSLPFLNLPSCQQSRDPWSWCQDIWINSISFRLFLGWSCELARLGLELKLKFACWGRIGSRIRNRVWGNQFLRLIVLQQLYRP